MGFKACRSGWERCATSLPGPFLHLVAMNKTTHHILRWRDALAEMTRVAKPGGYIIYADLTTDDPGVDRSAAQADPEPLRGRFHAARPR